MRALGAAWAGVRLYYGQPGFLTVVNGMAILFSIPLIFLALLLSYFVGQAALVPALLVLLLGVMPNPAAAGVHFCARELVRDDPVVVKEVWAALKRFWKQAVGLYAISGALFALIVINIIFYAALKLSVSPLLELIWFYLLLMWLMAQIYLYPMLFAMEQPRVVIAYKNALVVALRKPFSTTLLLIFWLAVLLVCCTTGLVLLLGLIVPAIMQQSLLTRQLPGMGIAATGSGPPLSGQEASEEKSGNAAQERQPWRDRVAPS